MALDHAARGRLGGLTTAARVDSTRHTVPARRSFLDKFQREVDPDGMLPPAERDRRAAAAMRLYFTRLAHKRHRKAAA